MSKSKQNINKLLVVMFFYRKEYFYSPLDGMPVHHRYTPSIKFLGTHLYTRQWESKVSCPRIQQNNPCKDLIGHKQPLFSFSSSSVTQKIMHKKKNGCTQGQENTNSPIFPLVFAFFFIMLNGPREMRGCF